VLAVLLVLIAAGLPVWGGDRGDQSGGAIAEPGGEDGERIVAGAAGSDVRRVVLDGVVQQGRARHVSVGDAVVAEDPDGDPQRMAGIGFALPPVPLVQPGHQRQSRADAGALPGGEPEGLDQQPLAQAAFPVH
jgi:hypothetical protein